jgi:capsular exopolysaccharide synthesis family protein
MASNQIERVVPGPLEPAKPEWTWPGSFPAESDEAPHLLDYWRILRKRRWTVVTIFVVLFVVVLIGTVRQTPIYRAQATLQIDKDNPQILSFQEIFQLSSDSDEYLETQYKILQSHSLAMRVIDELGLDRHPEFLPQPIWPWGKPAAHLRAEGPSQDRHASRTYQVVLRNFLKRLGVDPVRRSRLVRVGYDSADPALAAQVVNALANSFINQNLEARWEATQKASDWLAQELTTLKVRLEKSDDELQRYARQNAIVFLEDESGQRRRIVDERLKLVQEELSQAEADRIQKESLYRLVQQGDLGSLPGVFESPLTQELTLRLAELKRQFSQLTSTFSANYPQVVQLERQIDEVERVLAEERKRGAQKITNDYLAAVRREEMLRAGFERQKREAEEIAEKSIQYNILKREVDTNKQLYEGLLQRLKEAGVSAGLKASNVRVVDPAEVPQKPVRPMILLNLALGVVFGLGLGASAAFLQEYLDNTLKSPDDVERYLRAAWLGLIPSVASLDGRRRLYGYGSRRKKLGAGVRPSEIISHESSPTALQEAYRSLRTSILLSAAEHAPRTLLVTSASPGEGKTTTVVNLAIALAQLGSRVLVIDSDLRKPRLHRIFQLDNQQGLVSHLTGLVPSGDVIQHTYVPNMDVVVCGPVPPNPSELLSAPRMEDLVQQAIRTYDVVILDSPPVLNVSDARILARIVEGVVLVVEGGKTQRELVRRARALLAEAGGNLLGVVLNNVDVTQDAYYYERSYYNYYSSYGESSPEEEARGAAQGSS